MYYNENFYDELSDLVADIDLDMLKVGDIITVEDCDLEPIGVLSSELLMEFLTDKWEDRQSENGDEWIKVEKILKEWIDFETITKELPKLWYPNGKEITFTYEQIMEASE